jgi:hypothetical protein
MGVKRFCADRDAGDLEHAIQDLKLPASQPQERQQSEPRKCFIPYKPAASARDCWRRSPWPLEAPPADRRTIAPPPPCPSPGPAASRRCRAEVPVEQDQFTVGGAGGRDPCGLDTGLEGLQPGGVVGGWEGRAGHHSYRFDRLFS